MGKLVIEKWQCDRCHTIADREPRGIEHYRIAVSVDYETAGGSYLDWKEMCAPCNQIVRRELEAMKKSAVLAIEAHLNTPPSGKE